MPSTRCDPSTLNCFEVPQSAANTELAPNKIAHTPKAFMPFIVKGLIEENNSQLPKSGVYTQNPPTGAGL
jgi:hypothetical protein